MGIRILVCRLGLCLRIVYRILFVRRWGEHSTLCMTERRQNRPNHKHYLGVVTSKKCDNTVQASSNMSAAVNSTHESVIPLD